MGWLWNTPKVPSSMEEHLQNQGDPGLAPPQDPGQPGSAPQGLPQNRLEQPQKPQKFSGFDPSGHERAAKAIREIDKSPNAKGAIEITLKQEETKKAEAEAHMKEIELQLGQETTNRMRAMEEEKRKTLKEQQRYNQQNEQYKDRLSRKRHDDQLEKDRSNNEEILRRQEESVKQQELMRRETVEYQEKLRHENEMKRITAKIAGKAKLERENHDLNKEKLRLQAQENRETYLQIVSSVGNLIGTGVDTLISNRQKIIGFSTTVFGLAVSLYGAKYGMGVAARYVERRLRKPTLVRETSRLTLQESAKQLVRHPINSIKRRFAPPSDALDGVVINPALEARLKVLTASTFFTQVNRGTYRNLLMYGPPGTGKTLFAKKLAHSSNMDFAIITGGDIAPMGKEGVTAMHKVFDWGAASRKGLILFVDEADAFLRKRTEAQMSEDMRSTLNAFLYRTGESSKKMMLVMASNRPDHLDWAVNDRLDEMIEFPLPGVEERDQLLNLYFKKYVSDLVDDGTVFWEEFDVEQTLRNMAEQTDGFSGREISKLGIAWQASTYASPDKTFREKMLWERLDESIAANKQKAVWKREEGIEGLVGT